jgi:hypothetical protein
MSTARKELGFFDPLEYEAYGVITCDKTLRKWFWIEHPELDSPEAEARWVEWLDELDTVGKIPPGLTDTELFVS